MRDRVGNANMWSKQIAKKSRFIFAVDNFFFSFFSFLPFHFNIFIFLYLAFLSSFEIDFAITQFNELASFYCTDIGWGLCPQRFSIFFSFFLYIIKKLIFFVLCRDIVGVFFFCLFYFGKRKEMLSFFF